MPDMLRVIAAAVLLLPLLYLSQANSQSATNTTKYASDHVVVCPDIENPCAYALAYESSQSQDPFLFYSKIVDSSHPLYPEYLGALGRFEAAGNCWKNEPFDLPGNSTRYFDWPRMRTTEDLEVCFFRLFNSLKNKEKTIAWLAQAGFETTIKKEQKRNLVAGRKFRKTVFSISGSMNSKTAENAGATQFFRRLRGWFGHAISFGVEFNAEDLVEHVGITVIVK